MAALGPGTAGFRVGDRVVIAPVAVTCGECRLCRRGHVNLCPSRRILGYHFPGGFAEYVAVPAAAVAQGLVLPLPDHLAFAEACLAEPLACVLNGQEPLAIGPDDTVVILGGGAIGLLHAQVARLQGARQVLVSEISPQRAQWARAVADGVIDASAADPVAQVRDLTDGYGADVVIVAASAAAAQEQAIAMVGKRGRVSLFAGLPRTQPTIALDSNKVHYGEIALYGASASTPRHARRALDLLASGQVSARAVTTHRLPLAQITQGFALALAGQSLKVVIEP